jgi:hypothetical protein
MAQQAPQVYVVLPVPLALEVLEVLVDVQEKMATMVCEMAPQVLEEALDSEEATERTVLLEWMAKMEKMRSQTKIL